MTGRGNLKETMWIQIISFVCLLVLLAQFHMEFLSKGLNYSVPWVGHNVSQLGGVILFNYAFSVTVPSWLIEKQNSVSVNKSIWCSALLSSTLYISFGLLAAMCYQDVSADILTLLASPKVWNLCMMYVCRTIVH